MEITSVGLKNFKIHQEQWFEFRPGINAICGENGAGKTSIIEAIAWVLFDYRGYTTTELIRNGCMSAQAWVNFISSYDGRPYRIQRCTTKGYEVYDPQLQRGLGLKNKDDIARWLKQQLGVATDLSLPNLFSEMIGIPQGTFTADFLKNPEGRKKVFEPILRVDDYKNAFQKSLNLKNYSQTKVQQLEQQCQLYQQQLGDWELLQHQEQELLQELAQDQHQLNTLVERLETLHSQRQQLQAQAETIQTYRHNLEQQQRELATLQTMQAQQSQQLHQAQTAATLCQTHAPAYHRYLELSQILQQLNQDLERRVTLEHQGRQTQAQLLELTTQLSQLQLQLNQLEQAESDIAVLLPQVPEQLTLEGMLQSIRAELATLHQATADFEHLNQEQDTLQAQLADLTTEIERLESLQDLVTAIPTLEAELKRESQHHYQAEFVQAIQERLSPLLDQSQSHLQELEQLTTTAQGLMQAWPETLLGHNTVTLALEQGFAYYRQLYQELEHFTGGLVKPERESELLQLQQQLDRARQAQLNYATLPLKQNQCQDLRQRLQQLEKQRTKIQARLEQLPGLEVKAEEIEHKLAALGNPQGQLHHLQAQLKARPKLEADCQETTNTMAQVKFQSEEIQNQLNELGIREQERQQYELQQQNYINGYQLYLQNINLAQQLQSLEETLNTMQEQQQFLHETCEQLKQELLHLSQGFNSTELDTINQQISQLQSQGDQLRGSLPLKQAQLTQIQAELKARSQIAAMLQKLETELKIQRDIDQFIQISRQVFNQSGPRITQYYMTSIVHVADQLLRELLNRADVTLAWTEDYEIRIQEGGHWRSFKSLSGGEQMCAALAIRLALLKVLVEIDVAFFDEPTTNMDQSRRNQLAESLCQLRSFRQLFVISHDDAFEHMTENIIRVSR